MYVTAPKWGFGIIIIIIINIYLLNESFYLLTDNSNAIDSMVNGSYSKWSAFGPCSVSCGGGKQQRVRYCNNPVPKNGGSNCSSLGTSVQMKYCNIFPCMAGEKIL